MFLPPGEWTNFIKTATSMKNFTSSSVPKTNFIGVDVCLIELCACLVYGFEMDIPLANALQASIIVIFVPNADECHFMQQFIKRIISTN